jgi:hypothetical protein
MVMLAELPGEFAPRCMRRAPSALLASTLRHDLFSPPRGFHAVPDFAPREALVEDCCPKCHSTDTDADNPYSPHRWCNECAAYIARNPGKSDLAGLILASHLADALDSYVFPERELRPRELAALVEHAAYLHLQVAELHETGAGEAHERVPSGPPAATPGAGTS